MSPEKWLLLSAHYGETGRRTVMMSEGIVWPITLPAKKKGNPSYICGIATYLIGRKSRQLGVAEGELGLERCYKGKTYGPEKAAFDSNSLLRIERLRHDQVRQPCRIQYRV
jgi:hypothetical protein